MASLVNRISALISAYGADVKSLFARSMPAGGSFGQVLKKTSGTDYDVAWGATSGIPAGGATGQILKKSSATDFDTSWEDAPTGTGGTGSVVATQAGKPFWRGFVSANGGQASAAHNFGFESFTTNNGGTINALLQTFLTPIKSIPGLFSISLPQVNSKKTITHSLGPTSEGASLFMRGQVARFQGSIRFAFINGVDGVFFSGVSGGNPSGGKYTMTGYGVTDNAWTGAVFGSNSGYVGGCAGLGYEPGDTNLQFVKLQGGVDAVKIDSGVSIESVAGVTIELTFELNSGGTSMSFLLKNVDTDTTLATAIVQLPSIVNSTYTISVGIGNRSLAGGNHKILAISHMLFANPPGSQPA